MSEIHEAYLNIGSNLRPENNLPRTIQMLREYGQVEAISSAWESQAFGSDGPNFLNACVLFKTKLDVPALKADVIRPIETALGRIRSADKFAPRVIDIDIILFDGALSNAEFWSIAFVVVPLAELLPDFPHPFKNQKLVQVSEDIRREIWIEVRPEVLSSV